MAELKQSVEYPQDFGKADSKVDQIRDLLFGTQMRDYEARFKQLEQLIHAESKRLTSSMQDKLSGLETQLTDELLSLSEQSQSRWQSLEQKLSNEHDSTSAATAKLHSQLEQAKQAEKAARAALTDKFNQEIAALRKAFEAECETLRAGLDTSSNTLEEAKVDRNEIASLLSNLAKGLGGKDSGKTDK